MINSQGIPPEWKEAVEPKSISPLLTNSIPQTPPLSTPGPLDHIPSAITSWSRRPSYSPPVLDSEEHSTTPSRPLPPIPFPPNVRPISKSFGSSTPRPIPPPRPAAHSFSYSTSSPPILPLLPPKVFKSDSPYLGTEKE
jgi:hypothetical protein